MMDLRARLRAFHTPWCGACLGGTLGATLALVAAPAHAQGAAGGFDCLIEPSQVVEVRSAVDGLIANVAVKRGDPIKRGQVLVELQSTLEKAALEMARYRVQMSGQIASARNRLKYAEAKLKRLTELQQGNFASAQQRDEAEAERLLAESELKSAEENRELAQIDLKRVQEQLALRTLVAPFNGVVLDRMLHPGDLAEAGSGRKPVLKVAQIDPLKVDIVVPSALFGAVRPGTRVTVMPRGLPGRHVATVVAIDKVVDAASGTFVVRLDLANPTQAVPGGVRCSAEIDGVAPPAIGPRPGAAGGRASP